MPRKPAASYHHGDLSRVLLEVALAMVREHGADGFSLRAAAKQAGVDPAAVYRHYADKQALLARVAEQGFVELAVAMEAAALCRRKAKSRLLAVGDAYVRFALREPWLFRMMFGPNGVEPETVDALAPGGRSPYRILLDTLAALREAGDCAYPPERAALPAWSSVHGLASLALDGRIHDVDAAIREVLHATLRSLRPDPPQ